MILSKQFWLDNKAYYAEIELTFQTILIEWWGQLNLYPMEVAITTTASNQRYLDNILKGLDIKISSVLITDNILII